MPIVPDREPADIKLLRSPLRKHTIGKDFATAIRHGVKAAEDQIRARLEKQKLIGATYVRFFEEHKVD